ncbi:MAG: hypothetical protein MZU97_01475 [Bacillus subtilis]|nr:hypothetical protein [Bacillus subtilis]
MILLGSLLAIFLLYLDFQHPHRRAAQTSRKRFPSRKNRNDADAAQSEPGIVPVEPIVVGGEIVANPIADGRDAGRVRRSGNHRREQSRKKTPNRKVAVTAPVEAQPSRSHCQSRRKRSVATMCCTVPPTIPGSSNAKGSDRHPPRLRNAERRDHLCEHQGPVQRHANRHPQKGWKNPQAKLPQRRRSLISSFFQNRQQFTPPDCSLGEPMR